MHLLDSDSTSCTVAAQLCLCYLRGMARAESFCGVILAAGFSTRMGRDKALLPWPPVAEGTPVVNTFLGSWIDLLQQETELVIVVAGHNRAQIAPIVFGHGGFLIENENPERGQFSSIQTGLQDVLNRGRDGAVIALVDRPPVVPGTIRELKHALWSSPPEIWGVVPEIQRGEQTSHGHPVAVGRDMIEAFLRAPAESTARDVEHQHRQNIRYLPVDDPYVAMNIDTPEDYERLRSSNLIASGSTF
jgi:molybdenum cofactor cytidylyltransferase